jgi:hypothetical protein
VVFRLLAHDERVVVLEDTSTTGGSPLKAIEALRKVGAEIAAVAIGSAPIVRPPTASTSGMSAMRSAMTSPMSGATRPSRLTLRRSM